MQQGIQRVSTALGEFSLKWEGERLSRVGLPGQALEGPAVAGCAKLASLLQDYAKGGLVDPAAAKITLADENLRDFQRRVLLALRKVPRGKTLSYAELAERAGSPAAARAVGQVMRTNPWPLIVPCHRVLASGGKLGGFSSPRGTSLKVELLRIEGVVVQRAGAC